MLADAGAIIMDEISGSVTVSTAVPDMPAKVAVMVALPATSEAARPLLPAALEIWATAMSLDVHVTWVVRSGVLPLS